MFALPKPLPLLPASRFTPSTTWWRTLAWGLLDSGAPSERASDAVAAAGLGAGKLPENLGALLVSGGIRKSCASGASRTTWSCWVQPSTMPPAKRTTKWPASLASGTRVGLPSTNWHAGATPKSIRFPPWTHAAQIHGHRGGEGPHRYDWSFSGLKTAVARCVEQFEARGEEVPVADIAAAFQEAVVDVISSKAVLACKEHGITDVLLGGGVAANSRLRELTGQRCTSAGIKLHVPPLDLCTDNGAMVAALGAQLIMAGIAPSGVSFAPDSSMPVTTVSVPA